MTKIIDKPGDIEITLKNIGVDITPELKNELFYLNQFIGDIHSIAAANGKTPSKSVSKNNTIDIEIGKVRELHDQMNRMGMPNYLTSGNDTRVHTWVTKAINHGIENMIGGVALDKTNRVALETMILNGVVNTRTESGSPILEIPNPKEITAQTLKNRYGDKFSESERKEIEDSYKVIVDNLTQLKDADESYYPVRMVENYTLEGLTTDQLKTIQRAAKNYELDKLNKEVVDINRNIIVVAEEIEQSIKTLEIEEVKIIDSGITSGKEIDTIREALNLNKLKKNYIDQIHMEFFGDLQLGVGSARAAAIVQNYKMKIDNNTILQRYHQLINAKTEQ